MTQENGSGGQDDPELRVYRLRFTDRALAEIEVAHDRLAEYNGQDAADVWEKGLFSEVAKLATLPLRHPAPLEAIRFRGTVRQVLYRRSGHAVYRVIFVVREESLDGPTVVVFTVRHGSARPISRAEARAMEQEAE